MKITKEEKKLHIELWKESGLTKTEYAQQIGINRNVFYSWFNQLQNKNRTAEQGLVPDSFSSAQCEYTCNSKGTVNIAIELPNHYRVEVYSGVNPETLHTVLSVLEHL
ncbi:MAG: hypothetical protein GF401_12715 [Chitinivibrionales bacterium]|nr:hypothetical protein [Chitinivibrionales bacterium]